MDTALEGDVVEADEEGDGIVTEGLTLTKLMY